MEQVSCRFSHVAGKLAMTNHPGTTRRAATAVGGKHYQKRVPRWRDRVRVKSMQCAIEGGGDLSYDLSKSVGTRHEGQKGRPHGIS